MTAIKFGSVDDQPQESAEHRGTARVPEARSSASEVAQRQVASRSDAKCEKAAANGDDNRLSSPANPLPSHPPGLAQAAPKPASKDTSHAMNQPPQAPENQDAREKHSKRVEVAGQHPSSSTASHQLPPPSYASKASAFTSVGGQGTPEPRHPNPEAPKNNEKRQAPRSGQEDQHEVWNEGRGTNTSGAPSTPGQANPPSSQEGRINDTSGGKPRSRNGPYSNRHPSRYANERSDRRQGDSESSNSRSRYSEQPHTDHSVPPDSGRGPRHGPPRERQPPSIWSLQNWLGKSEGEVERLQQKQNALHSTLQQYAARIAKTEADLAEAEQRIVDSKALADTRLVELRAFQELMPMNDGVSGADLKSKWEALNNEIEQVAAIIVDSLTEIPVPNEAPLTEENVDRCMRYFSEKGFIDMRLLSLVHSPGNTDPSLFIQVSLQAAMVCVCRNLIISIAPFHANESFLYETAAGIKESAPFPVFAKWRALTHAQCIKTADQDGQFRGLLEPLRYVLCLAGRVDALDEESILLQSLQDRLWGLLSIALELNKIIMQEIFTMNVDPFAYGPGEIYHPVSMQSEIPPSTLDISNPNIDPSRVVCSTGMGLFFTKDTPSGSQREYAVKAKVETQLIFIDTNVQ